MAKVARGKKATRDRAVEIYQRLEATYPDAHCTLEYGNAFQLLIMTILAAQCTDARVNIVSKDLFKKYKKPEDFLNVPPQEVEKAIQSCGFFRQKTKSIQKTSEALVNEHGGRVPDTMEELTKLPGVGRKTANVILGECYDTPGVIVDTHCTRVTRRLGFTKELDAGKIEKDLMQVWPRELWTMFSHYMVYHGRAICVARSPKCSICPLFDLCPFPDTPEGRKVAR